jgi:hypothetical protein
MDNTFMHTGRSKIDGVTLAMVLVYKGNRPFYVIYLLLRYLWWHVHMYKCSCPVPLCIVCTIPYQMYVFVLQRPSPVYGIFLLQWRYKSYVEVANLNVTTVFEPWRRGLVVTSPPATEEIGAIGREIESRQGIHRVVVFMKTKLKKLCSTLTLMSFSLW